ncbi:hypothetical protein [Wansuia hejianensis]|uniref:Uncharacterized protein n=1 Tax=Wansuia hejianensis TaxID=2763667 RepID=A0A926F194_9FIRM|nr:hypothetical protein [Wansuia hejianensis]MBC8590049.1 hypothetical protein [Wansuia hejianensis]
MFENNNNKNNKDYYLGLGIGFGLIGGTLFATILKMFIKSSLVWFFAPGLGMLVGMIIGIIIDANKNKK